MIYPYVKVPVSYYIIKFGTDIIVNYYIGLIHFLAGNLKIPDGFGTSSLVYPQKKTLKKSNHVLCETRINSIIV